MQCTVLVYMCTYAHVNDSTMCRSYGRPPAMVVHVMNAVCLLLGQPTDWKTVKQLTRDGTAFLKMLYSYDKENVPDKVRLAYCVSTYEFVILRITC